MSESDVAADMIRLIYSFSILLTLVFTLNYVEGNLPDKVLCNDESCNEPISWATSLITYNTPQDFGVSFKKNVKVLVVAKPYIGATNTDSWGIVVNGVFGFAPLSALREGTVLKHPKIVVNIETLWKRYRHKHGPKEESQTPQKNQPAEQIDALPSEPKKNHNIESKPIIDVQTPHEISQNHVKTIDKTQNEDNLIDKTNPENTEQELDVISNIVTEDKINREFRENLYTQSEDSNQEPTLDVIPNNSGRHNHQKPSKRNENTIESDQNQSNSTFVNIDYVENSTNDHMINTKIQNNINTEQSANVNDSVKPILHNHEDIHKETIDNTHKSISHNHEQYSNNDSIKETTLKNQDSANVDYNTKSMDNTHNQAESSTNNHEREATLNNDSKTEHSVNVDSDTKPIANMHKPTTNNNDHVKEATLNNDLKNEAFISIDSDTQQIDNMHKPISHNQVESSTNDHERISTLNNDSKTEHSGNANSNTKPIDNTHEPNNNVKEAMLNNNLINEDSINADGNTIPIDNTHKEKSKMYESSNNADSSKSLDNTYEPKSDNDEKNSNNDPKIHNSENTQYHINVYDNSIENSTNDSIKEAKINTPNDNVESIAMNNVIVDFDPKIIESPQIVDSVDVENINNLYRGLQDNNVESPPDQIPVSLQTESITNQQEHVSNENVQKYINEPVVTEQSDNENEVEAFDSTDVLNGINSSESFSMDNNTEDDTNEQKYESPYHQPPSSPPMFHGSTGPHLFHYQPDSKDMLIDKPHIDEPVTTEALHVIDEPEVEIKLETSTVQYEKDEDNVLDDDDKKSSFASSMFIFGDLYDSILHIYRSSVLGPSNSEELKSNLNNNDYTENTHSSQNIMSSLFSETLKCSADERVKPTWSEVSSDLIFWLVTSAISVLMFTLGYYYLENRKQDGKLLAMVNTLQKELLCSTKECIILKEDLNRTKEILTGIEDSSFGSNEMFASLKQDLAGSQKTIEELEEKLVNTEEELANSTEAAFELQSILNEQLVSNEKSSSLAFTVTQLQTQLDDQQSTMNMTKSQLASKMEENEILIAKIVKINDKSSSLETDLIHTQESLSRTVKENEIKSKQIDELTLNIEKSLKQAEEQKKLELRELQKQLDQSKIELIKEKASLKSHKHEIQSLQDGLKALQLDEKNINSLIEATHTNAELVLIASEKTFLSEKVEADHATIVELTENINRQNGSITEMKEQLVTAERNALEATTRLEVLTKYFKEKEAELLKELNNKESMWLTQQGEAMSITEKIGVFQKQIQQYKETSESLRREVAEQEAAWRARIAALEQRAHDEWLARRAAERSAEASAREAQALRQRLAAPSPDKRVVSPLTTGEVIPDPAFMPQLGNLPPMMPPPPLGFLPNPHGGPMMMPPPFPLPPHRPPPLGRLSSPPPTQIPRQDRSYSPDSRYSPDRDYRARSPMSNQDRRRYNDRRYDNNRYYDSEEERRSRRYETETDFSPVNTLPPSPIPNPRNHKGISSGSGHSFESLERFK